MRLNNVLAAVQRFRSGSPWLALSIVFAIAAALTFLVHLPDAFVATHAHFARVLPLAGQLNMRAEDRGDHVLVHWNQDNDFVRSSTGGVLRIRDGYQQREVPLDSALVKHGSILYRPETNDVSLQLEIRDWHDDVITGSMRLLDGARPTNFPMMDEAAVRPAIPAAAPVSTPGIVDEAELQFDRKHISTRILANPQHYRPKVSNFRAATPAKPVNDSFADARQIPLERLVQQRPAAGTVPVPVVAQLAPPKQVIPFEPVALPQTQILTPASPAASKPAEAPLAPTAPVTSPGSSIVKDTIASESAESFVPPKAIRQVMPDLRKLGVASTVYRSIQVEVNVKVNEKGRVTQAKVVDDRNGRPPFVIFAALSAAKEWTFEPATLRGQKIASDHVIVFRFNSGGR